MEKCIGYLQYVMVALGDGFGIGVYKYIEAKSRGEEVKPNMCV